MTIFVSDFTRILYNIILFYYRKDDLIVLCEQALQYIVLLDIVRNLVQSMISEREHEVYQRGRPRIQIEEEQLRFLVESNFRIVDIASLFGCSRRTIERRMREYGVSHSDFNNLSDAELDQPLPCNSL